jgi:hypothetical protein
LHHTNHAMPRVGLLTNLLGRGEDGQLIGHKVPNVKLLNHPWVVSIQARGNEGGREEAEEHARTQVRIEPNKLAEYTSLALH